MTRDADPTALLAAADPAHDVDPEPREDLLAWTMARPRPRGAAAQSQPAEGGSLPSPDAKGRRSTPRPALRRWRPLLAVASIVACTAGALVASGGPAALDIAAKAYAQTAADPDQIIYTLVVGVGTQTPPVVGDGRTTTRLEEWHRGRETHRIETYDDPGDGAPVRLDHVISADGVMKQVDEVGRFRTIRPTDGQDAATVIDRQQRGFVAEFRSHYERGEIVDDADATFDGHRARRLLVRQRVGDAAELPPAVRDGQHQAYYVDRETGAPIGFTSEIPMVMGTGAGDRAVRTVGRMRATVRIQRLDPTPGNLRRLRELSPPRTR